MASIISWIKAARVRTLPLAVANVGMGSVLAAFWGHVDMAVVVLTILTALLLQILSNFANDYGDMIHGADGDHRQGPKRMVQSGAISTTAMRNGIIMMMLLSLISGIGLLWSSPISWTTKGVFFGLGMMAIWAAYRYTAGDRPYGYRGLGDISVFLFFGLLAVLGSYVLHGVDFKLSAILPAISCGCLATAVLNVNNVRDEISDRYSGKHSLVVQKGRAWAVRYHAFLLTTAVLMSTVFVVLHYRSASQFLFLITLPLFYQNWRAIRALDDPKALDPYLKKMALSAFLFCVMFAIGHLLTI